MRYEYNNPALKENRQKLRLHQTDAERALWHKLRNRRLEGLRFVRQYAVGPYIIDFYCPKIRLGIELDGEIHKGQENRLYDKDREKYLDGLDIKTIRFWNNNVLNNTKEVLDKLQNEIKKIIDK